MCWKGSTAVDELIKKLTEAWGPSGFEHQVRDLIREEVSSLADEVRVDALGNLICRIGDGPKRVMTAAHMDEIGLIVSHIDQQGYARFAPLGSLYPSALLGSRVRFENGTLGTVSYDNYTAKRTQQPALDGFYLDISTGTAQENPAAINTIADIQVGDPAAFVGTMETRGSRIISKSLDNRIGCVVQIEAMRRIREAGTPHSVYFVFTVQEEVGSRGAQTSAYGIAPDLGIAIDVTPAGDQPKGWKTTIALGKGVAIKTREVGLIVPPQVKNLMVQRAQDAHIPYQLEVLSGGGTDGKSIQMAQSGVPTGVVSVPVRNVHSTTETIERADVEATIDLLTAILTQPFAL